MRTRVETVKRFHDLTWTNTAMDCYNRGCRCQGCALNDILECKCRMKYTVLKIVRIHGAPPVPKINKIEKNDIVEMLYSGMLLRDIAKKYNMSVPQFRKITQAYGINGYDKPTRGNNDV